MQNKKEKKKKPSVLGALDFPASVCWPFGKMTTQTRKLFNALSHMPQIPHQNWISSSGI